MAVMALASSSCTVLLLLPVYGSVLKTNWWMGGGGGGESCVREELFEVNDHNKAKRPSHLDVGPEVVLQAFLVALGDNVDHNSEGREFEQKRVNVSFKMSYCVVQISQ